MQNVATDTPDERSLTEERHVEHRPLLAQLHHDEHDQQQHAHRRATAGSWRSSSRSALPRRIPNTIRKSAAEKVTSPSTSVRRAPSSRGLGDPRERDGECEDADRDVHEEDPAPAEPVGEEAADQRSGGDRGADRRAPDRERAEAVGAAVLVADQRERCREERGAADPLQRTGDVERGDVPGERRRGATTA